MDRKNAAAAPIDLTGDSPSSPARAPRSVPASKGRQKKAKAPVEKRAMRHRKSCPSKLVERIERAATQRLFLVSRDEVDPASSTECNFVVLGSTGNVYTVTLAHVPQCTCPDFCRKQDLCKHILFVNLKVLGLPANHNLVYQKALLTSELKTLFTMLSERRVGGASVMANARVQESYARLESGQESPADTKAGGDVQRRVLEDGENDCPICFDPMSGGTDTTYCRTTCGYNFHSECIRHWLREQRDKTCPNCRSPWEDAMSAASPTNREGYVNLGTLQGQRRSRDTSTYSSPPRYKRGRNYDY